MNIYGINVRRVLLADEPSRRFYDGAKYLYPFGWDEYKLAATVPEECTTWPVAFHGTPASNIPSILEVGLRKPGETKADGGRIAVALNHIPFGCLVVNGRDHANHVFLSPSIDVAAGYAFPWHMHLGNAYQFVVKARVRPDSFVEWQPDLGRSPKLKTVLTPEWLVFNSRDIVITALLVRCLGSYACR